MSGSLHVMYTPMEKNQSFFRSTHVHAAVVHEVSSTPSTTFKSIYCFLLFSCLNIGTSGTAYIIVPTEGMVDH
jgi:hypothetical protein